MSDNGPGCPTNKCRSSTSSDGNYSFRFRNPPTSTLFPYTTLFRSREVRTGRRRRAAAGARDRRPDAGRRVDRKSTRLNSSHSQISYAVFCLKKKNNNRPTIVTRDTLAKHSQHGKEEEQDEQEQTNL